MTENRTRVAIGQVIAHAEGRITVRLQRVETGALVVTVEHTQLVDELRRSFASEAAARDYARGICLGLRAGWSLDRIIEIAAAGSAVAA